MKIRPGVAAGHPSTAQAGAEVLARGGNAVDAAVAMMLVSCAAETIFTGLGRRRLRDRCTTPPPAGALRRLLRQRAGPGWQAPRARHRHRGDLRRSADALRDRAGHRRRAGCPGRRASPVAALGTAALGRRGRSRTAGARTAPRSPRPTRRCCPRSPPRWSWGTGSRSTSRPDGTLLQAGDPLVHHRSPSGVRAADRRPRCLLPRRVRRALVDVGGRRRRTEPGGPGCVPGDRDGPRRCRSTATPCTPAATTSTTCWGPCRRPRPAMTGDPLTDPAAAARALVEALRAPDRRAETTNVVAVDDRGRRLRDHHQPRPRVRRLGARVRGAPELHDRRGRAGPRAGSPAQRMGSMMSPMVAIDDHGALAALAGAAGGSRIRPALVQCVLRMLRGAAPAGRDRRRPAQRAARPGPARTGLLRRGARRHRGRRRPGRRGRPDRDPYFGGVSAHQRARRRRRPAAQRLRGAWRI